MKDTEFYPMTELPSQDDSDTSFSTTVIVYGLKPNEFGLGYFDFEMNVWLYLGDNTFLLKCWCYVPNLPGSVISKEWGTIAPRGYKKHYLMH